MHFDDTKAYFMPVGCGPVRPQLDPHTGIRVRAGIFGDVWTLSTSYRSTKDVIAARLPPGFEPDDQPIVTVYYMQCRQVNVLAGGGYNLIGLNLAASFRGKEDFEKGNYSLVLWENHCYPIIRGRELLGAPKLFADIIDAEFDRGSWHVEATDNRNMLIAMTINQGKKIGDAELSAMEDRDNQTSWLGWRYIPNINGIGAALSEPTLIGKEDIYKEGWIGDGTVTYGDVTWEASPMSGDIVQDIKGLTVEEYIGSTVTHGSSKNSRELHRVLR